MLVILRLLAPAVAAVEAAIVGTDRRLVQTLRRAGASSPGSAAHLGDPRPLRRRRIARLAGAGALRRIAEGSLCLDEQGSFAFGRPRRARPLAVVGIITGLLLLSQLLDLVRW